MLTGRGLNSLTKVLAAARRLNFALGVDRIEYYPVFSSGFGLPPEPFPAISFNPVVNGRKVLPGVNKNEYIKPGHRSAN